MVALVATRVIRAIGSWSAFSSKEKEEFSDYTTTERELVKELEETLHGLRMTDAADNEEEEEEEEEEW